MDIQLKSLGTQTEWAGHTPPNSGSGLSNPQSR